MLLEIAKQNNHFQQQVGDNTSQVVMENLALDNKPTLQEETNEKGTSGLNIAVPLIPEKVTIEYDDQGQNSDVKPEVIQIGEPTLMVTNPGPIEEEKLGTNENELDQLITDAEAGNWNQFEQDAQHDNPQELEYEIHERIPECLTNKDIRENGYPMVQMMQDWAEMQKNDLNIKPLMQAIDQTQQGIQVGKELQPDQFRAILTEYLKLQQ